MSSRAGWRYSPLGAVLFFTSRHIRLRSDCQETQKDDTKLEPRFSLEERIPFLYCHAEERARPCSGRPSQSAVAGQPLLPVRGPGFFSLLSIVTVSVKGPSAILGAVFVRSSSLPLVPPPLNFLDSVFE